jgi:hypothetical protein
MHDEPFEIPAFAEHSEGQFKPTQDCSPAELGTAARYLRESARLGERLVSAADAQDFRADARILTDLATALNRGATWQDEADGSLDLIEPYRDIDEDGGDGYAGPLSLTLVPPESESF